jgi:hypothetical protein
VAFAHWWIAIALNFVANCACVCQHWNQAHVFETLFLCTTTKTVGKCKLDCCFSLLYWEIYSKQ